MDEPWPPGPGVIELPDGTRFRGRGLRRASPPGPDPTFGLLLLGRKPPPTEWPSRWIVWPDFRVPRDPDDAVDALLEAHRRATDGRVEVACGGGRGRTGTALACLAVLAGLSPDDAIPYVRDRYDRHAVETPFQRRFVRKLGVRKLGAKELGTQHPEV